ncbi:hypothetical protein L3X38_026633 [Prunus dulcis]|uniref:Uncharacterized protein n=1 Tax=Prunus dulcis TaxID=3755 RepID=A0AAD4VN68_PRUDU|nr:hypothetical protein L3X38_026633 [Prunus dulcis]
MLAKALNVLEGFVSSTSTRRLCLLIAKVTMLMRMEQQPNRRTRRVKHACDVWYNRASVFSTASTALGLQGDSNPLLRYIMEDSLGDYNRELSEVLMKTVSGMVNTMHFNRAAGRNINLRVYNINDVTVAIALKCSTRWSARVAIWTDIVNVCILSFSFGFP